MLVNLWGSDCSEILFRLTALSLSGGVNVQVTSKGLKKVSRAFTTSVIYVCSRTERINLRGHSSVRDAIIMGEYRAWTSL